MTRKEYIYNTKIKPESLPLLQDLARDLGHYNTTGGPHDASPAAFLDALAAAYERDPDRLKACLRSAGVARERG
jgi:hypothetical protein